MGDIQHYKARILTNFVQFYRSPLKKLHGIVTRVEISGRNIEKTSSFDDVSEIVLLFLRLHSG
ncbi:MAG: hypothetical protein ABSE54_08475 [Smithella sp.]